MGIKMAAGVLQKTPAEDRIILVDFGNTDLVSGETVSAINSVTITPTGDPNDLVKLTDSFSGQVVQLKLSKGRDGFDYEVKTRITTSAGQIVEGCVKVEVRAC